MERDGRNMDFALRGVAVSAVILKLCFVLVAVVVVLGCTDMWRTR